MLFMTDCALTNSIFRIYIIVAIDTFTSADIIYIQLESHQIIIYFSKVSSTINISYEALVNL